MNYGDIDNKFSKFNGGPGLPGPGFSGPGLPGRVSHSHKPH